MKQATYAQFGPLSEVVTVEDIDTPDPGPGQVRLRVERSPMNPSDLLQVQGLYGVRPPLPAVPGNEGIARVDALGAGVEGLSKGQLVLLPAGCGAWQQALVVSAAGLVPLPEADLDQLAMLTVNPPTAFLLLDDFVDLQPGDWVIQSAANSAVGGYVVQLAAERGLRTINIVRREDAIAPLKALGADVVVLDGPEMEDQIREAIGDGKIRLGIDAVAGPLFGRMAELLATGGTMVSYGAMTMQPVSLSPQATIFNDIQARGFWLARWFERATPERRTQVFGALIQRIAMGKLHAPIAATYGIDEIHKAMEHASAPGRDGKVLLAPNG